MARRIFHINVNVTDMERSVAFYKQFGFREDRGAETEAPGLASAFATRSGRIRWTHLLLGEGPGYAGSISSNGTTAPPTRRRASRSMSRGWGASRYWSMTSRPSTGGFAPPACSLSRRPAFRKPSTVISGWRSRSIRITSMCS